jgi:hypothetical protein
MPFVKTITGHTSAYNVRHYLEKNQRALDRYEHNLCPGRSWSEQMDATRRINGHDYGATYRHYIISPQESDSAATQKLVMRLARQWAKENFPNQEWVVILHDDNKSRKDKGLGGIIHAHIVVNVTEIDSGNKMHVDNERVRHLDATLNERAKALGFTHTLAPIPKDRAAHDAMKAKGQHRKTVLGDITEKHQLDRGDLSDKQMIRDVIDDIRRRSINLDEFKQILTAEYPTLNFKECGAEISYHHPNWNPKVWVRGKTLGEQYAKSELVRTMQERQAIREGRTEGYGTRGNQSKEADHNSRQSNGHERQRKRNRDRGAR